MDSAVQSFLDRLAEVLEVPSIALEDDFRSVPLWSSLAGFSVLLMLENEYGRVLSVEELRAAETVGDLAREIGIVG